MSNADQEHKPEYEREHTNEHAGAREREHGNTRAPEHEHGNAHAREHEHEHAGTHDHEHEHGFQSATSATLSRRVNALIAGLERRGVTGESEIATTIERFLAAAGPNNGARLVARAWIDAAFKALLLQDANAAIAGLGLDLTHWAPVRMRAVENTADVHNVIVCTLCSCYPIALLGPSPTWYKSEAYRSRVVREPRAVLREFGCVIPAGVTIRVWDSTAELRYFVIPRRPAGSEALTEPELAELVSRDALIGVALATTPS